jgi:type II secretory pathway component PulF
VLLLLRRKLAEPLLLLSLAGVLVWFAGFLLVPALREGMSSEALLIPLIIVAFTWTIFWFARHSRMRGWLR